MDMKEVGKRIRELRENRGMKRNQLANRAGVSPTYVYQLENGEKSPTVEYLNHICEGLNVTLVEFFTQDNREADRIALLSEEQKELLNQFLKSLK